MRRSIRKTPTFIAWWRRQERRFGRLRLRVVTGGLAALVLFVACLPAIQQLGMGKYYNLNAATLQLVGENDMTLTKQLTYDTAKQAYVFNKDVVAAATSDTAENPLASMQASVGAKDKSNTKSYALTVPEDFSQGVTYYDSNSNLSFKLIPQFDAMNARIEQGHLVFPLANDRQAIYTLKNNGLKEDIVLPTPTNDTETYTYTFDLPKSLAVRFIPDGGGAIGIYSADPALFGNVSYGTEADRAKVEKARETAEKTNLVFALPAPVIASVEGKSIGSAFARFELNGKQLSVVAENLKSAGDQPLSIDPSVVITSTADFEYGGNDEGNIDFSTSGQVTRGGLTGGDIGAWASTTSMANNIEWGRSVFYNGYMYVLGGYNRTSGENHINRVTYAQVNSDGTLGTWTATTVLPDRLYKGSAVAYNGYLYYMGGTGWNYGGSTNKVHYAHINADGSIGSWVPTTNLPQALLGFGLAAADGYVYVLGGSELGNTGISSTVYSAPLSPSGAVGAWTTLTASELPFSWGMMTANIYNGYIYIFAGAGVGYTNNIKYAKINGDGTLGSWMSAPNLSSNSRYGHVSAFYNGYVYVYGGIGSPAPSYRTTVEYAQVNANGSLGPWVTSANNFTDGRTYVVGGAYKGYLYIGTGFDGTTDRSDFQYAKIQPQGKTATFANGSGWSAPRRYHQTVAIYGQLYIIGGDAGSTPTNVFQRKPINADGTLGAYVTLTALPAGVERMLFGAFAYDGYLYVLGGCKSALASCDTSGNALNTVYSATVDASGTVGTWTLQTNNLPTARYGFATAFYNGYVYIMGGTANGGGSPLNSIEYGRVTNGTIDNWATASATYNLPAGLTNMAYAISGNNVYLAGGCTAGTAVTCTTRTNAVYRIKLSASGGLASTWSTDTSFTTARYGARMTAVNGVLYLVGGYDGTSYYSDVQYALIDSSGGVGSWQTGNPTTISQMGAAVTTQNGMLYVIGGYDGSYQTITNYANTNNGGRGQTGTWTTNGTNLSGVYTSGIGYAKSVALNGYIYIIGGSDGSVRSTVSYAALNVDGSVGSWATTSSLQTGRQQAAAFTYNGYVYVVGGKSSGGTPLSTIEYAKANADGTLGAWAYTSSLNSTWGGLAGIAGAIYKDYMYITGGSDNSSAVQNETQYAHMNTDGTLGAWTATTSFTTARQLHSSVAVNGYLYVMGGYAGSGNNFVDVQMAPINSNGSVGSWAYTSQLPLAAKGMVATSYNGYVYVYSGDKNDGTTAVTYVWYAPINADGSIGDWQQSAGSTFSTARTSAAGYIYNGYMYLLGGSTVPASSFYSDVQYAPVNSIARKGQYSTQLAVNAKTINSIVFNGVLPGLGSVEYTALAANGTVVASGKSSDGVNIIGTACATTTSGAAYLFISVTLDDTTDGGVAFPDASSAANAANITDITVNYEPGHPAPSIRLRHNQTLQTGALSALDTCIEP